MTKTAEEPSRTALTVATAIGVLIGVVVAVLTSDVIVGVMVGAPCVAIGVGLLRLWSGGTAHPWHP